MALALLLALITTPAQACTWWWSQAVFDPEIANGVDVPTDASVVLQLNGTSVRFEVVPVAGGAPVPGQVDWFESPLQETVRIAFTPDAALQPLTTYAVDVFIVGYPDYAEDEPVASTEFTTGAGPAAMPEAPEAHEAVADEWREDKLDRWYCTIGNPVEFRSVELEVDLPAGEPWSWLVVRDSDPSRPSSRGLQHVEPLPEPGPTTIAFDQVRHQETDCFAVSLRSASGVEVPSDEICLADPPVEADCGGCQTPGSSGPGWLAVGLVAALGRRRRPTAPR